MALTLSPKDLEDLKPYVDKTVQRIVGSAEPTVTSAALNLIASGADKYQVMSKLSTLHPALAEKGHKLTDLIFELVGEYAAAAAKQNTSGKKRSASSEIQVSSAPPAPKIPNIMAAPIPNAAAPVLPLVGQVPINPAQVREMMANAQRMIEERKRALQQQQSTSLPPPGVVIPAPIVQTAIPIPVITPIDPAQAAEEKKRKLAELQSLIQSKIAAGVLGSKAAQGAAGSDAKPTPLVLDNEGRAVDTSGKQLLFPQHQPTLKANIRSKQRKMPKENQNEFSGAVEDEPVGGAGPSVKFFDERLAAPTTRPRTSKRTLQFNEPGKYVQLGHRQRTMAQLHRLQEEIADKARKTGISTAARLAKLSGETGGSGSSGIDGDKKNAEYIPQVEWWDSLLFEDSGPTGASYTGTIKPGSITRLIEHPIQLRCPTEPHEPVYVPVFLTKKEMKKLRRQNRREAWKEKQEKIRLGLEPPPEPKVRISNLMRVLGVEAVQDPTKVEAHVRAQMAKRLKTHVDSNASRKLTPEQKRDKKSRKLAEDTTLGVHVSVYRIDDLTNQSKKFKVEQNAKQLTLSGVLLLFKECNLVVVEGGPKQQKKYKRLMLNRIKWTDDLVKDKASEGIRNKCVHVWEGTTKERAFSDLKVKIVQTEEQAREFLKKHGVENYWDLALSGSVLEQVIETV